MNTVKIKDFESDEIVVLGQNAVTVSDMEIHNRDIRREDRNEILAIDAKEVKFDEFLPGYLDAALADIPKVNMAISKFAMCMSFI